MNIKAGYMANWLPKSRAVGKGSDEKDQPSSWAGAVTLKTTSKRQKSKVLETNRQTDRQTEQVEGSRACD